MTVPTGSIPVPHTGWHLLAFASELPGEVTPVEIGSRRLVAIREADRMRVFDATCPHRGAHLGYGGRREGDCLVCPFHGKRIALGDTSRTLAVREHQVLSCGEAIFVKLSDGDRDDRGFTQAIKEVEATQTVLRALVRPIAVPVEFIVENAFDIDHFTTVHRVPRITDMAVSHGAHGELAIEGEFMSQTSPWQEQQVRERIRREALRAGDPGLRYSSRFFARAFSPGVVVTEFGPPEQRHVIITAAVPTAEGCIARVAVGTPPGKESSRPMLIYGSERAFAEDQVVWEHLDPQAATHYGRRDAPVRAYRAFCAGFGALT